jgi:hypothetical protein
MDGQPGKINWISLIGTGAVILAQLLAVVVWLVSEHSARVELEHRFNTYQSDESERLTAIMRTFDQKQENQDAITTRLEAWVSRLDSQGGRQLGIVTEKQNLILEIIRRLQGDVDDLRKREKQGGDFDKFHEVLNK